MFEQREENINNPSKVLMPPVTRHAWHQSVCLTPTHSGRQRNIVQQHLLTHVTSD